MKLLVVTRADEGLKEMTDLTHPIIKKFTKQWGAEFRVLGRESDEAGCVDPKGKAFYRLMRCHELLSHYDRVLHLDTDIVINKTCPNIFNVVPYDRIGTALEDKGSRLNDRRNRMRLVQEEWGDIGWKTGYINTGTLVVSRPHKKLFQPFGGKYWTELGYDDVHWGYMINYLGLPIFELGYKLNHMSMFSEPWNGSPSRFNSHIIHYAGQGLFPDKGSRSRIELIRDDVKKIWGDKFK